MKLLQKCTKSQDLRASLLNLFLQYIHLFEEYLLRIMNPYSPYFMHYSYPLWSYSYPFPPFLHRNSQRTQNSLFLIPEEKSRQDQQNSSRAEANPSQSLVKDQVKEEEDLSFEKKSTYFKSELPPKKIKPTKRERNLQLRQGRNANSNILRAFYRRLKLKDEKTSRLIQSIIHRHNLNINASNFMEWFRSNKIDHCNYINISEARRLFNSQVPLESDYAKVLRVLFRKFLHSDVLISSLTSTRSSKNKMKYALSSLHSIMNEMIN